jgi:hypothetical protein
MSWNIRGLILGKKLFSISNPTQPLRQTVSAVERAGREV